MIVCTFFGHRNAPLSAKPRVAVKIIELITKHGVKSFYVGAQGNFDHYVINALTEIKLLNPEIEINIVLPGIPAELPPWIPPEYTLVPEEAEKAPPRFAVDRCNRWMLEKCDFVVGYVTHPGGGAAKFLKTAENAGKTVINLADGITTGN